uniref:VWFA domain-containing protein n=1 Tax=Ciona savignyi TaxID=51511 RepID=H2YH32_CIOSA
MKMIFGFVIVVSLVVATEGLQCLRCKGKSIEECDRYAGLETCSFDQASCETEVRKVRIGYKFKVIHVSKQCKQTQACKANQVQNYMISGESTQCNDDQSNSVCRCCCVDDLCNEGPLTCTDFKPPQPEPKSCPTQKPALFRGEYSCTDGHNPGSVCSYECNEEYNVFPAAVSSNTCLRNGSWDAPMPCCARHCPTYLLHDTVRLYHASSKENWEKLLELEASVDIGIKHGRDSSQASIFFFSDRVHEETLITFKDADFNKEKFIQLFRERMLNIDFSKTGNKVNTATAVWYAINYLYKTKVGARDSTVPKILSIITDSNSDQDLRSAGEAARRDGILTYVYPFKLDDVTFDQKQLMDMAGQQDHIFSVNGGDGELNKKITEYWTSQFCNNPCNHVF